MCGASGQYPMRCKHQGIQLIPHSPLGPGLDWACGVCVCVCVCVCVLVHLSIHPSIHPGIHSFYMPNVGQAQGTQRGEPSGSPQSGRGSRSRHNESTLETGTITDGSQVLWVPQGGIALGGLGKTSQLRLGAQVGVHLVLIVEVVARCSGSRL
nr:uncharacterized protein LOC129525609 [Gorilla gorilla gorilla]